MSRVIQQNHLRGKLLFFEVEADRVDAVTFATLVRRAVIKHVPEVAVAVLTKDLDAIHAQRTVGPRTDILGNSRVGKRWPPGA